MNELSKAHEYWISNYIVWVHTLSKAGTIF